MRILLLRHGQSEANVNGRIQAPDDPLTPHGEAQARLLAAHVAENYTLAELISSNLDRARTTAEYIAAATGHEITIDDRFREIDNGTSVGQLWSEWRAANPDLAAVWGWDVRHADAAWEGGESGRDVCRRAFAALDELVERYRDTGETVGVVTHGGVIAWIAARLYGDQLETWPAAYGEIANCSITEIELHEHGHPIISSWNLSTHLGDAFAPHVSPVIPARGSNE